MKNNAEDHLNNQTAGYSSRSTMSSGSGLYQRQGILQRKQKSVAVNKNFSLSDQEFKNEEAKLQNKQQRLMQMHEYRRAAFFGSPKEQKIIRNNYRKDCDMLMVMKGEKQKEETRREQRHIKQCQDIFEQECREARMKEIAKREMMKKVAEDNLMISMNKKKQENEAHVRESLRNQQAIADSKVKIPTLIR